MQLLKKNLLYLKFNNKSYYTLKLKAQSFRFLAGMFIPMEHLVLEASKHSKNVYKSLRNLNYIDYNNNIPASFAENCYSQYPDPNFSSNFETSNLFAVVKVRFVQFRVVSESMI